jgi:hypothetical protein
MARLHLDERPLRFSALIVNETQDTINPLVGAFFTFPTPLLAA